MTHEKKITQWAFSFRSKPPPLILPFFMLFWLSARPATAFISALATACLSIISVTCARPMPSPESVGVTQTHAALVAPSGGRSGKTLSLGSLGSPLGRSKYEEEQRTGWQLGGQGDEPGAPCPPGMAVVGGGVCVDRYEASVVEVLDNGLERSWSPYQRIGSATVRAVSRPGVIPQAYVSAHEAKAACNQAGKRLCRPAEWRSACTGSNNQTYGYSSKPASGRCNDHGASPMGSLYPSNRFKRDHDRWTLDHMNDPKLNQMSNTVVATGEHAGCTNDYGVYDMVGNLHEWVDDPSGTFQGGYYLDTHHNGNGCMYRTTAHEAAYHDYSIGFRCCADASQQP